MAEKYNVKLLFFNRKLYSFKAIGFLLFPLSNKSTPYALPLQEEEEEEEEEGEEEEEEEEEKKKNEKKKKKNLEMNKWAFHGEWWSWWSTRRI